MHDFFRFVSEVPVYVSSGGRFAFGSLFFDELVSFFPCMWWSWFSLAGSSSVLIYCEAAPFDAEAGFG